MRKHILVGNVVIDDGSSASAKNPAAAALGRLGGLKGGVARAANMTPEERADASRQAAAARWAKVAAKSRVPYSPEDDDAELSGRKPKPFVFKLEPQEVESLKDAKGSGGQQGLHKRLMEQLEDTHTVTLDDRQFGELIRYMTRYGHGGFQARLHKAFRRSIRLLLNDSL